MIARPKPTIATAALARALALGLVLISILICSVSTASAETLPIRVFTVRDGLAHSRVNSVLQDAKGYLWICTWEGVSRFDGKEFVNYGMRDGLPNVLVNDMTADSEGRLWFATHTDGIARLEEERADMTAPKFTSFRVDSARESNVVYGIFGAADGTLWCNTGAGVYRVHLDARADPHFDRITEVQGEVSAAFPLDLDVREFCLVAWTELVVIGPGGVERWPLPVPITRQTFSAAAPDRDGRILVSVNERLFQFTRPASSGGAPRWTEIPLPLTLDRYITELFRDSTGILWIGTREGLLKMEGSEITRYTRAQGLSDDWIRCIREDRDGNIWIGTHLGGLDRLSRRGVVSYALIQGLSDPNIARIVESHDGRLYASTGRGGIVEIRGRELRQVPGSERPPFNRTFSHIMQDRRGDWWIAPDAGLYRFDGPDLQLQHGKQFGPADGFPGTSVFGAIHEDPQGRIWLGGFDRQLYMYDPSRSPARFRTYDLKALGFNSAPREFLDDPSGGLFMVPFIGIWRLRGDRFEPFHAASGIPEPDPDPRSLLVDSRGWLWIGFRFHGVSVTRDLGAEHPAFRNYSTRTGLASDCVWSIAEDHNGRIYLATSRGLDRIDPETDMIRHVDTMDGLVGDVVNYLLRDSHGYIWAGSSGGLSRIDPGVSPAPGPPPPIFIQHLEVGGEQLPVPETGTMLSGEFTLKSSRNNLLIAFAGIDFRGPDLNYQWKLEGADREWSRPMPTRTVQYARLAPGRYRFIVRALTGDGIQSLEPAVATFRVLPPLWRQTWFVVLVSVTVAALAYALHRARVQRALALERIRRQIATDLHDDIGSGLSQIAVLSEVGKRGADPGLQGHLDEMATLARGMRDSMSDIVWSVDPRKDHLSDLVQRMQQVSLNLLESGGVRVDFRAPPKAEFERVNLPPDRRRHLYLIFKEAVTNVARHAAAGNVIVEIKLAGGVLEMVVEDDGRGRDGRAGREGHGLASMQQRAMELGGRLDVSDAPGHGTRVHLQVPLR